MQTHLLFVYSQQTFHGFYFHARIKQHCLKRVIIILPAYQIDISIVVGWRN